MRERTWKALLIDEIAPQPGERVLDFGSGTGTLTLMIQKTCPSVEVIGVDIDPEMLGRARAKAQEAGFEISFTQAGIDDSDIVAKLGAASFDKVVSSLVFHHLARDAKLDALRNAAALLRPGGMLHIADWGRPSSRLMRLLFYPVQALDGFANTSDNVLGLLPSLMQQAGFGAVRETRREPTALGSLSFYEGRRA